MPEHIHSTSISRKARMICMTALLLAGSLSIWAEATASQTGTAPAASSSVQANVAGMGQTAKPLGSMLKDDGTLNLSSGFSGSLDPSGWQMVSAAGEPPRFVPSDTTTKGQSQPQGKLNPGEPGTEPAVAGDENWDDRFGQGILGDVFAMAVSADGSDVYVGGTFTQAGGVSANYVAMWSTTSSAWFSLGTGANNGTTGEVYALAVSGSDLYVGGGFNQAGGITAEHVAMWNGTAWSSLGTGTSNGTTGNVYALAVSGSNVYLGGSFIGAGGVSAKNVARWSTTTNTWSSLGAGTNNGTTGAVYALAVAGSNVYVGGTFTQAGTVSAQNVALWTGSAWSSLGTGANNGTDGSVVALVLSGIYVYVGGEFTHAGTVSAQYIAKWNGITSTWTPLISGAANGTNNFVFALSAMGNYVCVAGTFTQAGGEVVNYVAMWDDSTSTWTSFGSGLISNTGTNGTVDALAVSGSDLYVGGEFTKAGGLSANDVAKWSTPNSAWFSLGTGTGNTVWALAVSGSDVYVGGYFRQAGGISANFIAMWNGTAWSSLGSGTNNGTNGSGVTALAVSGSDLYVGGFFDHAGGVSANYIAKWSITTSTWSPLGSGTNGAVYALAVSGDGSDVYAGGTFTQAGTVSTNNVAMWNGTAWSPLSTGTFNGTTDTVYALAVSGSDVYAGGTFTQTGGVSTNNVAQWNGTAWSPLGTGTNNGTTDTVYALAVNGNDVYAGGFFDHAGGVSANNVAQWNGTTGTWSPLGTGTNNGTTGDVYALAVSGNDVYAGGTFDHAGGVSANNVAMWNGTTGTWSPLGSGANRLVSSLAISGRDVYAGGYFTQAGSKPSYYFGIWHSPVLPTPTPSPTPTQCTLQFEDVPNPSTFYAYVQCLACRGIINGYACGSAGEPCNSSHDPYFRPNRNVTRGQIAKIVALSSVIHTPVSGQTFEDVPPGSTFYTYTEQLYALQVMNGYPCGGAGEPCNPPNNRPYFRPNANATRGQLAKIDSNAAGYNDPPAGQTFQDVAVASTFYTYTQRLTSRGVMSGYPCGGAGEPCGPGNLPYFRPNADVTRGQTSKIVGNTFFANCSAR